MGRLLQFANLYMFKVDAELLGSIRDPLSDADFSLYAELENDILDYIAQQIIEQFEAVKVAATQGLEVAQKKVGEAEKAWDDAIADAKKKLEDAQKVWESHERSVLSSGQDVIDRYLSEISRLQGDVDKACDAYDNAMRNAERAVEQANLDRAAALAAAERDVENAKHDMNKSIDAAQRQLDHAEAALSNAFGNAKRAIDKAQREVSSLQNKIDDIKRTIHDYEHAPWYQFWKKAAIAGLWIAVKTLEVSKAIASAALGVARGILTGAEYVSKEAAVETARKALGVARTTGQTVLSLSEEALRKVDKASQFAVDQAVATLDGVQKGAEFVAFQTAKEALERFKKANTAAYDKAKLAIKGLMESAEFIAFKAAQAGLEVAQNSTQVLDAAKEALSLAEKASQTALSILEEVTKFGAHAVNIKTIILSGTLRGILGIGGSRARPFSAVVKGYIMGSWFDIKAEFDPREPVKFITAIFKQ